MLLQMAGFASVLRLNNIPLYPCVYLFACACGYVCTYVYIHVYIHMLYFFTHTSGNGHLGYVHILAIVNIAAVNIG